MKETAHWKVGFLYMRRGHRELISSVISEGSAALRNLEWLLLLRHKIDRFEIFSSFNSKCIFFYCNNQLSKMCSDEMSNHDQTDKLTKISID
jgi:hypothetical protein